MSLGKSDLSPESVKDENLWRCCAGKLPGTHTEAPRRKRLNKEAELFDQMTRALRSMAEHSRRPERLPACQGYASSSPVSAVAARHQLRAPMAEHVKRLEAQVGEVHCPCPCPCQAGIW